MKIKSETVCKMTINEIPHLDPIALYIENSGKGQGKITITCFNESWSYFWGAMGDRDLQSFFLHCDIHYLAGKLGQYMSTTEPAPEELEDKAKIHIIKWRKTGGIDKDHARRLYAMSDSLYDLWCEFEGRGGDTYREYMTEIFGDEFYECVPEKPSHKYVYLCRIIETVKAALKDGSQ